MEKGVEKKFDEAGEEISLLNQLVKTLEDSFAKFKKAYERKDAEEFNKLKVILIQTERRISESGGA